MELLKNKTKIDAINQFMILLEEETDSLSKSEIYKNHEKLLNTIEAIDIFYLAKYQEDTTNTIDEIKESAGKFVNAFSHGLEAHLPASYESYLLTYMLKENQLMEDHLNKIKRWFKKDQLIKHKEDIETELKKCLSFEKKFVKQEMILFPLLEERLPSNKPLEVLWSLHDDSRVKLKELLKVLKEDKPNPNTLIHLIGQYYNLIFGVNRNERLILFPIAEKLLSQEDKQRLFEESKVYGYVFIDELPDTKEKSVSEDIQAGYILTKTGQLSLEQFKGIMTYIPIDLTFIDRDDKVRYFNDRQQRHFPRNPSILGRLVKNCHPPKSVHIVEKIVQAFKNGEKDMADFWLQFKDSFIYITYHAVRSQSGQYLGTLEVSQDVTHIRALDGQKRLLDWE